MGEAISIPPLQPLDLIRRERQAEQRVVQNPEWFSLRNIVVFVECQIAAKRIHDAEKKQCSTHFGITCLQLKKRLIHLFLSASYDVSIFCGQDTKGGSGWFLICEKRPLKVRCSTN